MFDESVNDGRDRKQGKRDGSQKEGRDKRLDAGGSHP